jgi:histone H3/H4
LNCRLDSEIGAAADNRQSDFGVIDVPVDVQDTTVILAPQLGSSPPQEGNVPDLEDVPGFASDDDRVGYDSVDIEDSTQPGNQAKAAIARKRRKKGFKLSRYGNEYPSLPPAVIKRLAQTFVQSSGAKGKISADTLNALTQASDWFLEQVSDDLGAYAKHAGRKTIDESDMLTLLRR